MMSILEMPAETNITDKFSEDEENCLDDELNISGVTYQEPSGQEVEIMSIQSPGRVWVRLIQDTWIQFQLRLQQQKMSELVSCIAVGDRVLVRCGGLVCRGHLENYIEPECTVRLLDHGTVVTVDKELLRVIHDIELNGPPPFSFPVCVAGVEPAATNSSQWTKESVLCLQSVTRGKRVLMDRGRGEEVTLWVEDNTRDNPVGLERQTWTCVSKYLQAEGVAFKTGLSDSTLLY